MPRSSTNRTNESADTQDNEVLVEAGRTNVDEVGSPAETEQEKQEIATTKRRARVDENSFVSIYCVVDCSPTSEFAFRAGETLYTFTNIFEPKPMTVANFRVFAQTANGAAVIRNKKVLVSGDLPEDILKTMELEYDPNQVLNREKYNKALNYPVDGLKKVYFELCDMHKEVIERLFMQALYDNDSRATKEKFVALNEVTGKFKDVLREFAAEEADSYKE